VKLIYFIMINQIIVKFVKFFDLINLNLLHFLLIYQIIQAIINLVKYLFCF